MASDKPITTGVRLPAKDRLALDELAERFHNTPAGLIRLAVDNLITATKANGDQLPDPVVTRMKEEAARYGSASEDTDKPEAALAGAH